MYINIQCVNRLSSKLSISQYVFHKCKNLEFNMNNDDNPLNPNWTMSTSENGGHENVDELNELKLKIIALQAKVQVLETENKQLAEEKKIQDQKLSKLEKEMLEKSLENEVASQSEFAERNLKEMAELKVKIQKLTEENKAYEEKLKKLEDIVQMNEQKIGETENVIMDPVREMKVQLPLENWHDLLAFVPRSQLGNVVSEIGDRQFARIIQSFLHDPVREITLGKMGMIPPRWCVSSDLPMVRVGFNTATNMPDWPMPGNIKDFQEIDLDYVDMPVLNFLEKLQENSLLENVNLNFFYSTTDCDLQFPTQIVPFINNIDSINSPNVDLMDMVYSNNYAGDINYDDESSQLLLKMMKMTRILSIKLLYGYDWESSWERIDWCCSWLYIPRDDGRPRMLISNYFIDFITFTSLIERIKKDFETANCSVSFFVRIRIQDNASEPDYISIDNVKTNEKLVIKKANDTAGDEWKICLISRHPLNAAKNWIEENKNEIFEWTNWKLNRRIFVNLN